MKKFKTDIIIFSGLLILALSIVLLTAGQSTIDIQLHDTYFVIDKISLTILIVGPLTLLIFLARALTRKFKTIGTNVGLAIGLILVALITYSVIQLQQSYMTSIMTLDNEGLPDRGQFMADSKRRITWSWALFGFWVVALTLLIIRTIKIWKEAHASR
ncbi:hypothetical protein KK083_18475 [Fulvivirgaceae bacterium PWU4]|uniref:Uncharacterized protein n=1 Tax=Chryseosolibacter histidini TaxID=2782349 RepID=A0AAP2GK15_9BACT|nr:hypothetical protein [Chryseosolibacter histidini]MBT1698886.1 hypothetical protein [Chryseosolibacter histidini]